MRQVAQYALTFASQELLVWPATRNLGEIREMLKVHCREAIQAQKGASKLDLVRDSDGHLSFSSDMTAAKIETIVMTLADGEAALRNPKDPVKVYLSTRRNSWDFDRRGIDEAFKANILAGAWELMGLISADLSLKQWSIDEIVAADHSQQQSIETLKAKVCLNRSGVRMFARMGTSQVAGEAARSQYYFELSATTSDIKDFRPPGTEITGHVGLCASAGAELG